MYISKISIKNRDIIIHNMTQNSQTYGDFIWIYHAQLLLNWRPYCCGAAISFMAVPINVISPSIVDDALLLFARITLVLFECIVEP